MSRKLTLQDVEFTIAALPEDAAVRGNAIASGDDLYDREVENKIIAELEAGNDWAWCCVKVTARWKSWKGVAYLGGCSYKDQADFERDGYYEDLQQEALADLQAAIDLARAELCGE